MNSGLILAPNVYLSSIQIMPLPRPFQSWNAEENYHSLHYRRPFDFTIFPPKCYEASFKRSQSVNKNRLTTPPHLLCCTHRFRGFTSPVKNLDHSDRNGNPKAKGTVRINQGGRAGNFEKIWVQKYDDPYQCQFIFL